MKVKAVKSMTEASFSSQLRALDDPEQSSAEDEVEERRMAGVRKGVVWGAAVGLLFGGMWLVASVIVGALGGALVAKALQVRIEKGAAPRLRFKSKPKPSER